MLTKRHFKAINICTMIKSAVGNPPRRGKLQIKPTHLFTFQTPTWNAIN